jgi:VWFA-related protein
MRFRHSLALIVLAALPAAAPLAAQSRPPAGTVHVQSGQTASTLSQAKPPAQTQRPLRVGVNVVRLPVTVRGPHGQLALNFGPEDFEISDNGIPQHILHFEVGGNPMAVVLVVETSARVAPLLPGIGKSGIIFTEMVMGANGKGAVIGFDDTSRLLVPFTFDHDRIQKAVSHLRPGDDGAHLRDALRRAIGMLENQPEDLRRVIIAVSESTDTGSKAELDGVLRDAELADVSIYTIGLSTTASELRAPPSQASGPVYGPTGTYSRPGVPGTPQTPTTMEQSSGNINPLPLAVMLAKMGIRLVAKKTLKAASAATGGDHISTFHDHAIQQAMDRFGEELNAQYILAYRAPPSGPWGFHTVTVNVLERGYKVRTRPGYFLAPPNGSTTPNPQP